MADPKLRRALLNGVGIAAALALASDGRASARRPKMLDPAVKMDASKVPK